ncbi:hypothetical protein [Rhodococcus triatomae]|uniref:hypothetical protein n=1 Tax=Rhodococcus triatomae TaxID=300028 RepID=UPI001FEA9306|nr:hypothetical protein [Rhodococcus triatomae]
MTEDPKPRRRRAKREAGPPRDGHPATVQVGDARPAQTRGPETSPAAPAHPGPAPVFQPVPAAQPPSSVPEGPAPRRRPRMWTVIACVVVVALVAVAALLALGLRADDARDARRQAYVDAARQTILNLTTIHPDTAREDVDRLLAGASGEFAQEFEGRADPFVSVVADARVATEGEVIVAGLETETDSSATVLVAARAIVSSADQPEPSPRDFRMRVTITDTDGELTASRVEFVP